jgi:hypothetical protein
MDTMKRLLRSIFLFIITKFARSLYFDFTDKSLEFHEAIHQRNVNNL